MALNTTQQKYGMGSTPMGLELVNSAVYAQEPTTKKTQMENPSAKTTGMGMLRRPSFDYKTPSQEINESKVEQAGMGSAPSLTLNTGTPKEGGGYTYTGEDAKTAANSITAGASSGNYAGMGAGVGGAIGTIWGPVGTVAGSAIGGLGGGFIDEWLAGEAEERAKKEAAAQEKEKKRWQKYQFSLEERGRNLENEKLQYSRDDAAMQRMISAKGEALKTKNAILQSGNLYRARKGRNWYGPQGITAQVRGGAIPKGTTAGDLGYSGATAESVKIPTARGMGL